MFYFWAKPTCQFEGTVRSNELRAERLLQRLMTRVRIYRNPSYPRLDQHSETFRDYALAPWSPSRSYSAHVGIFSFSISQIFPDFHHGESTRAGDPGVSVTRSDGRGTLISTDETVRWAFCERPGRWGKNIYTLVM